MTAPAARSVGSRLTDLIALAQETSSARRRELLREVTDLFFATPDASARETELFDAVLNQLASEMEAAVRAELSERVAGADPHLPELVASLAVDVIEVAGPVLTRSSALDEDGLLDIVRTQGQRHLRAVSKRSSVPEAVSDVIVERGDDETLGMLLRNPGAALSRQATETAVDRAQANPALHEAVVGRRDLPPDLMNEMYFVVEARLRQRILEENARLDPAVLEEALAAGRRTVANRHGELPPDYEEAEAYVRELRAAGELSPKTLARFLRSGGTTHFLIALSQLSDIDFHTARHIVDRRQLDALAVVCKAADLERPLFLTYAVVLLSKEEDAIGRAQQYGRLYADLPRETALRTLRFWRLRRGTVEQAAA